MKLTLKTSDLASALARLKPIAGHKAALPILNSVLLRAKDGKLALSATDLDVHLTVFLDAQIEAEGETAVSCPRLAAAVTKIDGDDLALSFGAKTGLRGEACDWNFRLITFDPAEFPPAPKTDEVGRRITLGEGVLAGMLARVLPSVSDDDSRYILCGAHFTIEDGRLVIIATDGRRLVLTAQEVEATGPIGATVPTSALKLLCCTDGGGAQRLDFTELYLAAEGPGWQLATKLIEGNYPQWKQVIPDVSQARTITLGRKQLLEAIPFVRSVCTDKSGSLKLDADGKRVVLSANGPEIGETSAELLAKVKGGKLLAAYNPDYLADALRAVNGDEVTLAAADEMSPMRIDEAGTTCVLMPMRVS